MIIIIIICILYFYLYPSFFFYSIILTFQLHLFLIFFFNSAETTGIYTFSMEKVDEAAMVWMGTGGFDCCNPKTSQLGTADTAVL